MSYSPGLAGVIAGKTALATVGKKGHGLMYRGYSITDLTENCCFEEVAFLLTRGYLPTASELKAYRLKISSRFELPREIQKLLQMIPKQAHPMDILRSVCSVLGTLAPEQDIGNAEETRDIADTLIATFPSAITYHYNYHFKGIVCDTKARHSSDSIAYHFLRLLHNRDNIDPAVVRCLDVSLICYTEHGFAASSFASRVTTSTLSDCYSSICTAIGTLRGSLHGGANEKAFYLINSFSSPGEARERIKQMLRTKEKIMGFGHRVYKGSDPRAVIMQKWAEKLRNSELGNRKMLEIASAIQDQMNQSKNIFPNVDYPVAVAYHQCGIPAELFTPLFVCARTVGWMSHVLEQRDGNRIIRPTSIYVGPSLKQFVPIERRTGQPRSKL